MRGMLAIHIIRGYAHVRNLKDAWKKDIDLHNEGIANIMPYYRFQQIWKFFKVVDPHRRLAAGEDKEKFWIKEFLEQLNEGLSQCFIAAGVLIADEYLSGSSHHLSILRTLLRKPNKKGSLWFLLCSSYELAIAAQRGANGRRREAESAAAASTSKSSSAAPSTADALPGHAEKMAAKSATGREKFVQKVYIPHIAVLYTGGEEWREREQGPRGGLGPVIAKWRGFGEGACFLVYMLTILMAKGVVLKGTIIVADRFFTSWRLLVWMVTKMCRDGETIVGWWLDSVWVFCCTVGIKWTPSEVTRKLKRVLRQSLAKVKIQVPAPLPLAMYNLYMGALDCFNKESQNTYTEEMKGTRGWKHLWMFLFNMWIYAGYCAYMMRTVGTYEHEMYFREPKNYVDYQRVVEDCNSKEEYDPEEVSVCVSFGGRKRKAVRATTGEDERKEITVEGSFDHVSVGLRTITDQDGDPVYATRGKAECRQCRFIHPGGEHHIHDSTGKKIPETTRGCNKLHFQFVVLGACFTNYHKRHFTHHEEACAEGNKESAEEVALMATREVPMTNASGENSDSDDSAIFVDRVMQQALNLTDGEAMTTAEVETYRRERQRKGK
eukprot:gene11002-13015_t